MSEKQEASSCETDRGSIRVCGITVCLEPITVQLEFQQRLIGEKAIQGGEKRESKYTEMCT